MATLHKWTPWKYVFDIFTSIGQRWSASHDTLFGESRAKVSPRARVHALFTVYTLELRQMYRTKLSEGIVLIFLAKSRRLPIPERRAKKAPLNESFCEVTAVTIRADRTIDKHIPSCLSRNTHREIQTSNSHLTECPLGCDEFGDGYGRDDQDGRCCHEPADHQGPGGVPIIIVRQRLRGG